MNQFQNNAVNNSRLSGDIQYLNCTLEKRLHTNKQKSSPSTHKKGPVEREQMQHKI